MLEHYHKYQTVSENNDGLVEVCRECKKRLVTKKDPNGRIDNPSYLKEHIRDTAQPTGSTAKIFQRFYGKVTDSKGKTEKSDA
jgi:hypothetical protein